MFDNFFNWLLKPFDDTINNSYNELNDNFDEAFLIIDKNTNVDDLPITDTINNQNLIFRPLTIDEYIGQTKVKSIISSYIEGITKRNKIFPHTLIYGEAGTGKTTLARIIAKQLKVKFSELITSDIKDASNLIKEIQQLNGGVLFLDEIHSIDRNNAEKLYTVMEDFAYNGSSIKQFTLIGATTELGEIIKTRKPFYDRFKLILELQSYTIYDLVQILKQYKENLFDDDNITYKTYVTIASNCRNTPRNGIRLLEATIYNNGDTQKVLDNFNIVSNGYTIKDIALLEYLKDNGRALGLQNIAALLDTSQENYLYNIEPYLLKTGIIIRTSKGRMITPKGIELLKNIKRK